MDEKKEHSIVIIGAGPAGVVTSLYLSKYQIKHILIDKAKFPRAKVCGESFAGNVLKVLSDIDPNIPKDLFTKGIIKQANDLSFYTYSEKRFIFKIPKNKVAKIQAERLLFDAYLVDKAKASAYCEFKEDLGVKSVSKTRNGVSVELNNSIRIAADLVVFANGAVGNLLRNFRGSEYEAKGTQFLFAKGIFDQVNVVNPESAIDFALLKKPFRQGTYLTFLPDGKAILGLMVEERLLKKSKDYKLSDLYADAIVNHPYIQSVLGNANQVGSIKTTSLKIGNFKKKFSGDNYLVAGDAGVPLNPVTGMGVMMAMYYGRNAAHAIKEAIEIEDFSYAQLHKYDDHCRKKYNSEFRKSNGYTYLQTKHFGFFNRLIAFLDDKPKLAKLINRLSFGK